MSVASKTLAIKARVYNQIRTDLYKKLQEDDGSPSYRPHRDWLVKNKGYSMLTDKEKLELFDKWFNLNKEAYTELNNYKRKRRINKKKYERRLKDGYFDRKAAKRQKSKEYLELQKQLAHAI